MQINFGSRTVSCKIVYYGPGLSGKTTNIQEIHAQMPDDHKGDLTSIKTKGDRTLFFDFMSLDLGQVAGMDTRFQIYTVPGQVYYNATRKLVLQGADGIVFVADSDPDRMQENIDSWRNLKENLAERNRALHDLPLVVQWNKRDLANALATDEMNRKINTIGAPTFEASAIKGDGVLKTLKSVCALVCKSIDVGQVGRSVTAKAQARSSPPGAAREETRPAAAEKMRFVSRRMRALNASSESSGSATAVADPEVVTAAESTSPPVNDAPPEPPGTKETAGAALVRASHRARRSARVRVIVAAGVLAAAAAVAALLYVWTMW